MKKIMRNRINEETVKELNKRLSKGILEVYQGEKVKESKYENISNNIIKKFVLLPMQKRRKIKDLLGEGLKQKIYSQFNCII